MGLEQDKQQKRREKREAQRRQAKRSQLKLKLSAAAAVLIILGCIVGIRYLANSSSAQSEETAVQAQTTAPTEKETETTEAPTRKVKDPKTVIHIRAAGDLNITNAVVESGLSASGYDYTRAFMDVTGLLSGGDITVMNLEGNICGEPYGTTTASAPQDLLKSLRNSGVDMLQIANSYSINNGLIGLSATLNAVRNAGIEALGAYSNPSEFRQTKGYTLVDIQGIKVAFVAFTKGVGGMGMPAGNEDCVNLLYKDYDSTYRSIDTAAITSVLKAAASEKPDITIALLHWGSENNDEHSSTQTSIVSLLKKNGVSVIIGTHPHLVQKIDYDKKTGSLVAYSLGDFYGDGTRGGTNYSIILDVEITKDSDLRTTTVTDYSYYPVFTLKESECDGYRRVIRIPEAMSAYENNYVDKVSSDAYSSMKYALERIESRVQGVYK